MRVLITGAGGFLGGHLVAGLARRPDVSAVLAGDLADAPAPRLTAAWAFAGPRVAYHQIDITDRIMLRVALSNLAPDIVIHAAALTPGREDDAGSALRIARTNAHGAFTLFDVAMAQPGLQRAMLMSSAAVFGSPPFEAPLEEAAIPSPVSLYAVTKMAAETIALRLGRRYGVETVVVRLAALYGALEAESPSRPTTSHVHRLATAPQPVTVAGQDFTRDFVHADDAADAIAALCAAPLGGQTLFHLGGGEAVTWTRLLAAFRAAGRDIRDVPSEAAAVVVGPDDARPVLAIDRLRALIGYAPRSIEAGIRDLLPPIRGVIPGRCSRPGHATDPR